MRYSTSDKMDIVHTIERSHLSARQTLEKIGIPEVDNILATIGLISVDPALTI